MGLGKWLRTREKRKVIRTAGVWFVDIPRTSTTSLRTELGNHYGEVYAKAAGRLSMPCHLTALSMRDFLGESVWSSLFTFTFIRNPWERVFSLYCWSRKHGYMEGMEFDAYLDSMLAWHENGGREREVHVGFLDNAGYIVDEVGEIMIDYVGRYETREADIAYVSEKVGLPSLGGLALNKQAPHNTHYSTHYSDQGREIVARVHHRDIELFGYEF